MGRNSTMAALGCLAASGVLAACDPTAPAPPGGVQTNCAFSAAQPGQGLAMDCAITGTPANVLIDPLNPSNRACVPQSLTLFDQTVNASGTFIWGENGDENDQRVRIGVTLPPGGTHTGTLAKSAGLQCEATVPPRVAVNTSFGGQHVALVDKTRSPMCVFQSRLTLSPFTQNIAVGLNLDVSAATRAGTEASVARQVDLEAARAANRLLNPAADLTDAGFVARSGRCPGWVPFEGS